MNSMNLLDVIMAHVLQDIAVTCQPLQGDPEKLKAMLGRILLHYGEQLAGGEKPKRIGFK